MIHELPPLPFPRNALEQVMSAETVEYHYGKHHKGYVEKLNQLIVGTRFEDVPLEQIIRHADGPIFDNGAQAWNHTFFWNCLRPFGGSDGPIGDLRLALEESFGTIDEFKAKFIEAGSEHFGSGWVWLIRSPDGELKVEALHDAGNPLRDGSAPLLVCDLWEHAYYLDHRNDRKRFLKSVCGVLNWDFAAKNLVDYGQRPSKAA